MRRSIVLVAVPVLGVVVVFGIVRTFHEPACPSGGDAPVPVLVAKQFVPKGTSGEQMARRGMYTTAAIPCRERKTGAISDPAELLGTRVSSDLFPGQQVTSSDVSSG